MPLGAAFRVLDISGSGLSAERMRMETTAKNIANARSVGPDGKPYRKQVVIFEAAMDEAARRRGLKGAKLLGGVKVLDILEANDPYRRIYDPSNPLSDKEGYVTVPNISVIDEMVDMISASRAYEANLAVVAAAKDMLNSALTIGR